MRDWRLNFVIEAQQSKPSRLLILTIRIFLILQPLVVD